MCIFHCTVLSSSGIELTIVQLRPSTTVKLMLKIQAFADLRYYQEEKYSAQGLYTDVKFNFTPDDAADRRKLSILKSVLQ